LPSDSFARPSPPFNVLQAAKARSDARRRPGVVVLCYRDAAELLYPHWHPWPFQNRRSAAPMLMDIPQGSRIDRLRVFSIIPARASEVAAAAGDSAAAIPTAATPSGGNELERGTWGVQHSEPSSQCGRALVRRSVARRTCGRHPGPARASARTPSRPSDALEDLLRRDSHSVAMGVNGFDCIPAA
jgi:hypothetical protein